VGSLLSGRDGAGACTGDTGAFLGAGQRDPVGQVHEGELHPDPGDQQHQRIDEDRFQGDRPAFTPPRRPAAVGRRYAVTEG